MKPFFACLTLSLIAFASAPAQQPGPSATPAATPKVVDTSPKAWQVGASSSQKEISVTFDQPMMPSFTAWLGRSSVVPQVDVDSSISQDRKTFTMKAGLQPGKVYVFALNEKRIPGVGFQNMRGMSSPPYFLVFQTNGTPIPEDAPPRAVSTMPTHNAQQLDPSKLKSMSVTFDRPMKTDKHGLHMTESGKPVDLSTAKFQYSPDGKSFTLGYEFKPSSTYEFELNNTEDIGFVSAKRIPLWPVKLAFSTGEPQR
ncbi:MAG: Ig-like domain-containing protein [Chthoniobacterales bacterium]